ncbi:MAG: hypothetical protein ACI81A_000479, partial [Paraglaciecola sp.]
CMNTQQCPLNNKQYIKPGSVFEPLTLPMPDY